MVPRGLEPRTLRLLAVHSNQLSYETLDFEGCRIIRLRTANCATATNNFHSPIQHIFFSARAFLPWQGPSPIPGDFLGIDMRRGTAHGQWVGPAAPFLACPQSIGKLAQNKRLPPSSCGVCARGVCHSRAVGLFIRGAKRLPSGRVCMPHQIVAATPRAMAGWRMDKGCVIGGRCSGWRLDAHRRGTGKEASRGFEPRSLDSESRVLTITPRGH